MPQLLELSAVPCYSFSKMKKILFAFLAAFVCSSAVFAADPVPKDLADLAIDPKLGSHLPLDTTFQDHTGKTVKLGDFFDGHRPVALIMNYYGCPMLCGVVLNATRDALQEIDWKMGEKYRVIAISIDPTETYKLAAAKRRSILGSIKNQEFRAAAEANWQFLVGPGANSKRVADAIGFKYRYDKQTKEYAHGAALFFVSGSGVLTRALFGINYQPTTVRLALLEASQGKIGTLAEKLLLFCYHFDPKGNKYSILAVNLMKIAGAITVVIMLLAYLLIFLRNRRERTQNP